MIGQGSASVVADGYFAGNMDDATARKLYEGLLKSANSRHPTIHSVGRECANEYNKLGYVPMDKCKRSSGARTLEYAYADYCIWKLGVALGRPAEETAVYLKRSGNWRNIWRDDKKSVCARASDGSWDPKYSPIRWDYDFVEGTPLQYTWSIFHDIPGLMEALGGREKFVAALDAVFDQPPSFDGSYYGGCTHEIREMFVSGFGQYAHGNQPIQHMIYLYTLAGRRDRAAYWTRRVMDELYADRPDGYGGDEDNGQTSAWFVWSAMGMYPVCPVSGEYVLGAPLFDKITVSRPGAKSVEITRDSIGGKSHDSPTVKRAEIFGTK
jgi:predicted alpha-1,2-mannosidase